MRYVVPFNCIEMRSIIGQIGDCKRVEYQRQWLAEYKKKDGKIAIEWSCIPVRFEPVMMLPYSERLCQTVNWISWACCARLARSKLWCGRLSHAFLGRASTKLAILSDDLNYFIQNLKLVKRCFSTLRLKSCHFLKIV